VVTGGILIIVFVVLSHKTVTRSVISCLHLFTWGSRGFVYNNLKYFSTTAVCWVLVAVYRQLTRNCLLRSAMDSVTPHVHPWTSKTLFNASSGLSYPKSCGRLQPSSSNVGLIS